MAHPLRIEYPGAYYHVMNRGLSRRDIFLEDKGRESFLGLLSDISRLWKVEIHAYCLMDNHYHLLLQTPKGGLSRAMRHLDGIYTQRTLGGHKHSEIGRVLGLEKTSSVSSAYLRIKAGVEVERRIARKARRIEEELHKSQGQT